MWSICLREIVDVCTLKVRNRWIWFLYYEIVGFYHSCDFCVFLELLFACDFVVHLQIFRCSIMSTRFCFIHFMNLNYIISITITRIITTINPAAPIQSEETRPAMADDHEVMSRTFLQSTYTLDMKRQSTPSLWISVWWIVYVHFMMIASRTDRVYNIHDHHHGLLSLVDVLYDTRSAHEWATYMCSRYIMYETNLLIIPPNSSAF